MSGRSSQREAAAQQTHDKTDLYEQTILFSLSMSKLWTRRHVSGQDVEVKSKEDNEVQTTRRRTRRQTTEAASEEEKPDEAMLFVSKDILVSEELQAIQRHDMQIRNYLWSRSFPSHFRRGVYLIPFNLANDVYARLEEFKEQRQELIEEFLSVYPEKVKEAEKRLKALFDPEQYPSVADLRRHFKMTWSMHTQGPPETLKKLKGNIWEKELKKAKEAAEQAREEIIKLMRAEFAELIAHAVDRLTPDADGKPKIFKNSMVGHMEEFISLFDAKNIGNDKDLAGLVKKAKGLVSGINIDDLREDKDYRKQIAQGFTQIKASLDPLVEKRPSRRILLERKKESAA